MIFFPNYVIVNPRRLLRGFYFYHDSPNNLISFPNTGGYFMTYELFKEAVMAELTNHFPPDTQITIHSLSHNNGVHLDGLTILEAGCNAAPAIYLEGYYGMLSQGYSFLQIYQKILDAYRSLRLQASVDLSFFDDITHLKKRIVCKLIHYERNRELLAQIPHVPYLDLAIVFYSLLSADSTSFTTVLIRNSHLNRWNITSWQLFSLAMTNTPLLLKSRIDNLAELLLAHAPKCMPCGTDIPLIEKINSPLYLLTNQNRLQGAACILYPNILSDFSAQRDSDLYIIPSSIHEVLLLPASAAISLNALNAMIHEVNGTQLSPEDILSDHVYYYNRNKNKITF